MKVLGFYLGREVFFAERVSFVVISFVSLFVFVVVVLGRLFSSIGFENDSYK